MDSLAKPADLGPPGHSADDEVLLALAGDVMTGRGVDQALAHPSSPELHEPWLRDAREYLRLAERANGPVPFPVGPEYIWGQALDELAGTRPDARIFNLETSITVSGRAWPGKGIHYRMHPENIGCLQAVRPDCFALANNHVMDYGRTGLASTLAVLARAGIAVAGAGADDAAAEAPAVARMPGEARVLVFARATSSSGVPASWAASARRSGIALIPDPDDPGIGKAAGRLASLVAARRRPGDIVVLSLHWGANRVARVPDAHRALARRLIDLGAADVVHGHSSHHPLPIEIHRGKLILYGCGDLINDYEGIAPQDGFRSDLGCLYFATIERASGALRGLRIVPKQLRRLRLGPPEPAALDWLVRILDIAADEKARRFAIGQNAIHWQR